MLWRCPHFCLSHSGGWLILWESGGDARAHPALLGVPHGQCRMLAPRVCSRDASDFLAQEGDWGRGLWEQVLCFPLLPSQTVRGSCLD